MKKPKTFRFDTLSLHAGARPDPATGARATPIYQTASFAFRDTDHAASIFNIERAGHVYSRTALEMLTFWGHSATAHLGGSPTPGMWMLGCGLRLLEEASEGVLHADLNACNAYTSVETVVLPGSGHALLSERPDPVLDVLIRIV